MKLKNIFFPLVVLALAIGIASCSKKAEVAEEFATPYTVDSLMNNAGSLVGDTVLVEGLCSHLCKHGGTKAFLVGADSAIVLRCQATEAMGGAFAPDCVGKDITVTGIVYEDRLTEDDIVAMEERHAAADSAAQTHEACETDRKAQGQADIDEFSARMADYRARIAERKAAENRDYLSFYYLEAISYAVPVAAAE